MHVLQKIYTFFKHIFIHSAKKYVLILHVFQHKIINLLKVCGELNNLVVKVLQAPNLCY